MMASNPSQTLRAQFHSMLQRFMVSPSNFEILKSVPAPRPSTPDVLYVLDSSFNPPTSAHLRIASSALEENARPSARLLLLLATQNADKPSKPALFEDRLAMMELFAEDLLTSLRSSLSEDHLPQVDIGVTKKPYFVDKAAEIDAAGVYPTALEQVHLTGHDTLIRIFDPKYYPPTHTLQPLGPFLSQHRLRVTLRPDGDWGSAEDQKAFLMSLAQGNKESQGGKREWAQRIEFVEAKDPEDRSVSSTKAREAIRSNTGNLEWLVPRRVQEYISIQHPYRDQ